MGGIKKIGGESENYPDLLKKIDEPPKFLYIRGTMPRGDFFAIVGTRKYSSYGRNITTKMSGELAKEGLVIVSGLARGIDTFAHKGCLLEGGKTVAILGTGIDDESIYPKENLHLAHKIIKNKGCLISEYPPGTKGSKKNFLHRNRIISGISLGVLVVEAKARSGSLVTARWARKQKRKVFAIPGSIYSLNSEGPHILIKKGAILTEKASDVVKSLRIKRIPFPKIKRIEERLIREALSQRPLPVEKIIERTGLQAKKVYSILAIMEKKNQVENLGENIFAITK